MFPWVVALSVDFKRSQLRVAFHRLAPASAKPLNEYLIDRIQELFSQTSGAQTIRATAGGGHSVEFADGFAGGVSPADASALCSEFLDLYDEARSALVSAGFAVPEESAIVNEMLARLVNVRESFADFSNVREGVES